MSSHLSRTDHSPRFTEWARQYGEIFSLKLGVGTAIVITSPRLVKQLVDKKSTIYSNRPPSYIGNAIISQNDHMLLFDYDERWRKSRKIFHQFFMESMVVKQHMPLVNAEAVQMLRDFIVEPEGHMRHPKRFSNSIIVSLRKSIRGLSGGDGTANSC
jgi:cytochrome P450